MEHTTLYIKNMVCDRCVMAVKSLLANLGLNAIEVELGKAAVEGPLDARQTEALRQGLLQLGFELLDDRRQQTINRIKSLIIQLAHYHDNRITLNLSSYLSAELHADYGALSKLFSECTGMTIEHYHILQRVEKVKELITYNELTLTQIAQKMNYSSVAYLSSQFKQVTGMTPSAFKLMQGNHRKSLDKV